MATFTTKTARKIEWAEIKAAAEGGTLTEGDEVAFTLKSGAAASLTVAAVRGGRAYLVFTDCVAKRPMYEKMPRGSVSWKSSDLRRWANEEFLKELPDELAAIIIPRGIVQTVDGEVLETRDLLWAPSVTEMFGRDRWAEGDDENETQFPIFKTERARVKMIGAETWWYWLRSLYTGNATIFRGVYSDGSSGSSYASYSSGVCLGLCV